MKKVLMLATAAFLFTGVSYAHNCGGKKKGAKKSSCCKKGGSCKKNKGKTAKL